MNLEFFFKGEVYSHISLNVRTGEAVLQGYQSLTCSSSLLCSIALENNHLAFLSPQEKTRQCRLFCNVEGGTESSVMYTGLP